MSTDFNLVVLPPSTQEVLVRLVRLSIAEDGSGDARILERLTELAAAGLGVARASVWLRHEALDAIVCQDLFDGATHSTGMKLQRRDFPAYFTELDRSMVIPADDAHDHPATACFSASYLRPLGIGAMLDAPIWRGGKAAGVLCLEHVGGARRWNETDQAFAMQVALICGLYYERQERLVAERALHQQQEREHTNQKMEALGRMACAIGHDFNNLLTTIMGQTELLMRPNRTPTQIAERAGLVIDAANRAAALVKRLLLFGKGGDITEGALDLGVLMRGMQAVLRGLSEAKKSQDSVSARGSLDVLRYGRMLKARGLVGVRGAGIAYDGLYYVQSVTSNLKRGEFKQSFTLTRNGLVSITPRVPV